MKKSFEFDHHPEVVEDGKALKRIERLNMKEDLASPEARVKLFSSLTDEQYKKMFGYINSLTRGERINYDYEDGQFPSGETPPFESKEKLMNETFEAVRQILSASDEEEIDETELKHRLRKAGLTLAGGINYIHPKENGNGRTGRVLHYLMEYGSDRGDKVFEDELYSIIAKTPTYEGDIAYPMYDTPPAELERALEGYARQHDEDYESLHPRDKASARVKTFLEMMKNDIDVPIIEEVLIRTQLYDGSEVQIEKIQPSEIGGDELYERLYVSSSTVPNRGVEEISPEMERVKSERKDELKENNTIKIEMDLI